MKGKCSIHGCNNTASKLIHANMISEDCFKKCLEAKYGMKRADEIFEESNNYGHVVKNGIRFVASNVAIFDNYIGNYQPLRIKMVKKILKNKGRRPY